MWLFGHRDPVREFVVVGVGVVEEAPFLDEQAACVDTGPVAAVPAVRSVPDGPPDRFHRAANVLALLTLAQVVVADPAPSVTANVVAGLGDRCSGLGMALDREGAAEHGQRHV